MSSRSGVILYLLLVAAWLVYCGFHTFYIGRMPLLRSQALALGACFVIGASLSAGWVLLGLRALRRRLGWKQVPGLLDRAWVRVVLLLLLLLSVVVYIYGRFVEPRRLVVRQLPLGQRVGSPVRVAVISDLHISGDGPPWSQLADTVNATKPDMILLLGDTLNRRDALPVLHKVLATMKAPHGKYAVEGNWEAWYWNDLPLLEGTGFRWLDEKHQVSRTIRGITVHLVGLPYTDERRAAEAEALMAKLPLNDDGWRLFAYHTPDLATKVPSAHLYLAGHTHGGQISLPFYGAMVTLSRHGKRFERGKARTGRTVVYTNPGIGVEPAIPIRLGVPPEVTLVRLGKRR